MEILQDMTTAAMQIIQTVAVVTTLIVVGWYTIETHKLRKCSEEQGAAFRDQVQIAREQLNLAHRQAIDLARPRVEINPRQTDETGSSFRYFLTTTGGVMYGVSAAYEDGTPIPLVNKTVGRMDSERIDIKPHTSALRVRIGYHDGIGTKYTFSFTVCGIIVGDIDEKNSFENPELS
jgi:hypothetical protein